MYVRALEGLGQVTRCSDTEISRIFGVRVGDGRNELRGFDSAFVGRAGTRFRDTVERIAQEFVIAPALLAVNALAETGNRAPWLRRGGIDTAHIGLDFWDEHSRTIRRNLGKTFRTTVITDPTNPNCTIIGGVCHFINEKGNDTGRMHQFTSAQEGLRAMAAWLRILEGRLIDATGSLFGWIGIPEPLQWALMRLSYNPGRNNPSELARRSLAEVDAGRDPLNIFPRTGPGGPDHPLRTSVIRAAQALHLANTVFGRNVPCR